METTPPPAPTVLRAVSLDFDDTLIESEAMKRAALVRVASAFDGGEAALGRIDTDSRTGAKVTRHTIFRDFCREVPAARAVGAEALVDRYSTAVREGIATAAEVHGASRLLAELRDKGVPTFINSATPTSALQDAVKARGWDRFVSAALGAPEGGGDKVDNLAEVARRVECSAAEVAHVGDGDNDASAAQRFGCEFFRIGGDGYRDISALTPVLLARLGLPAPAPCRICEKNSKPDALPYGGLVWSSPRWLLLHASKPAGVAGHLMLHARRHVVGPVEFNDCEAAEFGPVLRRVSDALQAATGAKRIYTCFMSESSPHLHVHLVPRAHDAEVTGFDIFQLQARAKSGDVAAAADDACRAVVESVRADLAARPPL
jgi:phosphoglycolate phosphatase-like HAD superfamily hydrolase/diadenosine tetraphosphate (Ap4A) HIT family hydrolase